MARLPIWKKKPGTGKPKRSEHREIVAHAEVDDDLFPVLNEYVWKLHNEGYAYTHIKQSDGRYRKVYLHQRVYILRHGSLPEPPLEVDHENQIKMDCKSSNLRPANRPLQLRNTGIHRDNSSGYRGVSWHKDSQRWRARVRINYREVPLGLFKCKHEAARAVNAYWREHFPGEPIPNPSAETDGLGSATNPATQAISTEGGNHKPQ